jgi:uncharacterized phiE125 gp8 family phage protein
MTLHSTTPSGLPIPGPFTRKAVYRSLNIITEPAVEPVTLAEAKAHLRVDTSTDDALITSLITAARRWCEEYVDRAFVYTQYVMRFDTFPYEIELPRPPMAKATSFDTVTIAYQPVAGSVVTLDPALYRIDRDATPGVLRTVYMGTWPSDVLFDPNSISVTWYAGYGASGAAVPAQIRSAILMLVAHLYEHRMAGQVQPLLEVPFGVKSLLDSVRWGSYR